MKNHALLVTAAILAALLPACSGDSGSDTASKRRELIVYSGRNEKLIGPLLDQFQERTGIEVKVRYGGTAELAATILEEGAHSPAHVFLSQDAAALGALAKAGRLQPLDGSMTSRVPDRFVAPGKEWVGLSGRVRVVVYNTQLTGPEKLPRSLREVGDARFRGKFGVAPANASFEAHMSVFHAIHGETALRDLLESIVENDPREYPKNSAIVTAVLAGEVEWGLVNHYYLHRALQQDPSAPGANYVMPDGKSSSFINLAGAGILNDTPEARSLVEFLLSDSAQRFFAETTFEYPLVPGIEPHGGLQPLDSIATPGVDFGQVSDALESTLTLIQETGLLP